MISPSELRAIDCCECGRPWGVILPRGHDDTVILQAERLLHWRWREHCTEVLETPNFVVTAFAATSVTSVVHVSDADARWLDDIGVQVNVAEADTWNSVEDLDGPAWWINKRRRFALRWDCCNLTYPRPVVTL